jgi:hypothetical protein
MDWLLWLILGLSCATGAAFFYIIWDTADWRTDRGKDKGGVAY